MSTPEPDRKALEELWRSRLNEARLRVELARNFLHEVQRDFQDGTVPQPDGNFAYQRALKAENTALAEYSRILRVYHDLTMAGKIPEESDWPRHRAVGNPGGES
jgi:hypothetical protein